MRGNRGGDGVRLDGAFAVARLRDCLLAGNEYSRELIRSDGDEPAYVYMRDCTIAQNVISSPVVLSISNYLELFGAIIDQPGKLSLAYSGGGEPSVGNVLSGDITTLPSDVSIISGEPSFVDAANGDFHLCRNSLAVDFAEPFVGDDRDLDNLPRDQDLFDVSDLFGVRDLGAYELQNGATGCGQAELIFANGFE